MPTSITPPPSPCSSHPGAPFMPSKSIKASNKSSQVYNAEVSQPPRPKRTSTPLPHYQTRWEREKAKAKAEGIDIEGSDPKMIGPWILGEMLGKGASGRVRLARHSLNGKLAAVKILNVQAATTGPVTHMKERTKSEKMLLSAEREIAVMKLLDHPNIMKMYDVWSSTKELFLVLEYVEGGELFDYLCSRGSRLHIVEAISIIKQVLSGVHYCHTFNICHRDLKPENILLTSSTGADQSKRVKIADFGMSAIDSLNGLLRTSCGSPHYASPEIVRGQTYHGASSDIWSCGVILYALLTGRLPFDDPNVNNVLKKVRDGRFTIPDWVVPEAKDLLMRMLEVNIDKRISLRDIFRHPLLQIETPGIILPPAPNVDEYAMQVPRDDIDPDLLRCLCIILRENDRPLVIGRLCCQEKNFEKAFYVLLCRYRDRSFEEYNTESPPSRLSLSSSSIALVTPPLTPRYEGTASDGEFPFKRHYPGRASPLSKTLFEPVTRKYHSPTPGQSCGGTSAIKAVDFPERKISTRIPRAHTGVTPNSSCHSVRPFTNASKYATSRRRSSSTGIRQSKTPLTIGQRDSPLRSPSRGSNVSGNSNLARCPTKMEGSVERTVVGPIDRGIGRRTTFNHSNATSLRKTLSSRSFAQTCPVIHPSKYPRSSRTNKDIQGRLSVPKVEPCTNTNQPLSTATRLPLNIPARPHSSASSRSRDHGISSEANNARFAVRKNIGRYPRSKTETNVLKGLGVYVQDVCPQGMDSDHGPNSFVPPSEQIRESSSEETWEKVEANIDMSLQNPGANPHPRRAKRKPPPLDLQNPFSREKWSIASSTTASEAPKLTNSPLLSPLMNFVGFSRSNLHSNPSSPERASPFFHASRSHQSLSNSGSTRNLFTRILNWKTPNLIITASGTLEAIRNKCLRLLEFRNIAYAILDSNTIRCHAAESGGPSGSRVVSFRVVIGILSPKIRMSRKSDASNVAGPIAEEYKVTDETSDSSRAEGDLGCYTLTFIQEKGAYSLLKSVHEQMCQALRSNTSVDVRLPPTPLSADANGLSPSTGQLFS
ncbi:hypothetical protein FRC14_006819 [Serendipita sp. 396]|nr:hypothetical protein FRC14_006819 [Serendipita sp. 396]KAG8789216.1 hypothetical protein FRC15_010709 [Serendipita sp. 397]KAG8804358.1 hypothetical protein FRC16_009572 [Serendipita sp. 398]KAG8877781.1 hypothetical protein FRC20_010032 [Serendipita sp. 405]